MFYLFSLCTVTTYTTHPVTAGIGSSPPATLNWISRRKLMDGSLCMKVLMHLHKNINLKLTGNNAYLHMRENYNHVNHCSTVLSRLTALKPQITTEILVHGIQIT